MKNIFKLQIWVNIDEIGEEGEFRDLYFDVSKIAGWFIPSDNIEEDSKGINILFDGDMITVKQEPHIIEYLTHAFVEPSVINTK